MEIALYQPDIAQNAGAALRLAACMDVRAHIIEPCGFVFDDKRMKRAGMDYMEIANYHTHASWQAFQQWCTQEGKRLVLLTTKGATGLPGFSFQKDDILMVGRESAGVPDSVAEAVNARVRIPMHMQARSMNVITSLAMALAIGLDQTQQFPEESP